MTPATAVFLALEGAPIVCTPEEYPAIRTALTDARDLLPPFGTDIRRDALTEAVNALQREHLR